MSVITGMTMKLQTHQVNTGPIRCMKDPGVLAFWMTFWQLCSATPILWKSRWKLWAKLLLVFVGHPLWRAPPGSPMFLETASYPASSSCWQIYTELRYLPLDFMVSQRFPESLLKDSTFTPSWNLDLSPPAWVWLCLMIWGGSLKIDFYCHLTIHFNHNHLAWLLLNSRLS